MNIKLDSESVYGENNKHIKTEIKSYGDRINTNFQGKKIPKEKCIISVVIIDNVRLCC